MLDSDPDKPQLNSLHRRYEQLKRWEQSDFFNEPSKYKEANRVVFPLGTQFLAACSSGDVEEADRLLRKGVDVNTANVDGLTAVHQACIDNDLELVEFLVENGCDIDVKDNEGWTPLHATASCAYTEVAKYLLSKGAELAAVNNDGDLPVDLADNQEMETLLNDEMSRRNIDADKARKVEEQKMLKDSQRWLKTGRYIEVIDPKSGASPLHVAAAKGYLEVINILLKCPSVVVNCRDFDGWTPLHAAAHWGQERACEVLVDNNADMDLCTNAAQDIFEISEPDLVGLLRQLKNKQLSLRQAASSEISDSLPRKEGAGKRRSSVTRMSVDQKASVTSKIAEQEGIPTLPSDTDAGTDGAGDTTAVKLPSPVDEETPDVRPWVKRRQQIAAQAEADQLSIVNRKEKQDISPVKEESQEKEDRQKSPSPVKVSPPPAADLPPPVIEEKKPKEVKIVDENRKERKEKKETVPQPKETEEAEANGIEPPMVGPPPSQLNQRRVENDSQRSDKRVSAVMAPMKGEESETQRSARARHARATRRSTQGVSQDELQEAKKLLQTESSTTSTTTTPASTVAASSASTGTRTTDSVSVNSSTSSKKPSIENSSERNGALPSQQRIPDSERRSDNNPQVNDSTAESVTGLPTTRPRRHQRRHVLTSSSADEPKDSSESKPPVNSSSIPSRVSSSDDTKSTVDTITTSRRPLSTISSSTTLTSERSSPPSTISWRPRSAIGSVGGSPYGSSLNRTPTFHGTSTSSSSSAIDQVNTSTDASSRLASTGTTTSDDDWKTRRRARRGERPPLGKTDTTPSQLTGSSSANKTDSGRYSLHGDSTDSVRQSSHHRPNSYHDSSSPRPYSSRWGSSSSTTTDSGSVDYKKLYEQERQESERLRRELDQTKKDLTESRNDADRLRKHHGSSNVDTRRLERKLSEYEEEIKNIELLKQENAKMKEENGALIRVISKLSK